MPDISDLLNDAVPPTDGYDEDDVRRRVGRRRQRRRLLTGAAALLVAVLGVGGIVVAVNRGDDAPVVTDEPPTSTPPTTGGHFAAFGATSVAIVGDQVWIGGDGFVSLGDGSNRIEVPGPVEALAAGDPGLLWVRGDGFVAAVDVAKHAVVGTWDGDSADLVPLPSGEVAISLPSSREVAIVKTSAIAELEEVWRIPVRGRPGDIVRTTTGEVWVSCDDAVVELDVGAQGIKMTQPWTGPLLAPSLDGGIWTVEGERTIDLHPELLASGASVAQGTRYDVVAAMAVETPYGLYVGGPDGLTRHDPDHPDAEVITKDRPDAIDASGGQVAYVVGGEVHTAQASGGGSAATVPPNGEPGFVASRYLGDELHWPDVTIGSIDETGNDTRQVHASSPSLQRDADVTVRRAGTGWEVADLFTFGTASMAVEASVSADHVKVAFDYREDGLTPELTVTSGTNVLRRTADLAKWDEDLGFTRTEPGYVQILWRRADGVALEGWRRAIPAGDYTLPVPGDYTSR